MGLNMNIKIEEFVEVICDDLDIDVPKIQYATDDKFATDTQGAYFDGQCIWLRQNIKVTPDVLFSVAHELRHAYQLTTFGDIFFKDYKKVGELDTESYNMQTQELDAHAYASIAMEDILGFKPLYNGFSPRLVKAIKDRIQLILKFEYE